MTLHGLPSRSAHYSRSMWPRRLLPGYIHHHHHHHRHRLRPRLLPSCLFHSKTFGLRFRNPSSRYCHPPRRRHRLQSCTRELIQIESWWHHRHRHRHQRSRVVRRFHRCHRYTNCRMPVHHPHHRPSHSRSRRRWCLERPRHKKSQLRSRNRPRPGNTRPHPRRFQHSRHFHRFLRHHRPQSPGLRR